MCTERYHLQVFRIIQITGKDNNNNSHSSVRPHEQVPTRDNTLNQLTFLYHRPRQAR